MEARDPRYAIGWHHRILQNNKLCRLYALCCQELTQQGRPAGRPDRQCTRAARTGNVLNPPKHHTPSYYQQRILRDFLHNGRPGPAMLLIV